MKPAGPDYAASIRRYRHRFLEDALCGWCVFRFTLFREGRPRFHPPIPKAYEVRRLQRAIHQAQMEETIRAEKLRWISIIARMPITLRAVLFFRRWDNLNYAEIEARTGIPAFLVQRLIVRAYVLLVYYEMASE
ncbi:sigma factor-like helix-turn-helix DNA-binding protein [Asticcacaulis sp. MM231]|uniref:sigma factor-like helix-turn-helix DNA-binding protein n=1 Tax=Asticcacaulis sp. MM231 TaxID=3157666 RepID=UPI0032D58293